MRGKTKKETRSNNKGTVSPPNMESNTGNGALGKKEVTPFSSPVSIHVHSKRKRLVDADAVSAKAAIDGLVNGGLLQDDSSEFVEEVSYSQEQSSEEETIITIKEI